MKRIFSAVLALALVVTCCGGGGALAAPYSDPRASLTLAAYSAGLTPGNSAGKIVISYDVKSSKMADAVGVETIVIFKSTGTQMATINGSTSNGLVRNNSSINKSTYTYSGTSGFSYYAEVTIFAEVGSDYDSRTVTTGTIKAP